MANEVRLIDANALRQTIESEIYWGGVGLLEAIDDAPTIDPESLRPKGRWLDTGDTYEDEYCRYNYFECSVCECEIAGRYGLYRYCPNCGADMMEVKDENHT